MKVSDENAIANFRYIRRNSFGGTSFHLELIPLLPTLARERKKLEKKLLAYCCINVVVITCGVIFLRLHYNPEPFNDLGRTTFKPTKVVTSLEHGSRYGREIKIITGLSALLLVGCMFWVFYRKIKKENHDCIDECLIKKEEMASTSLWEWAIALLICPGCIILPVFITVFFGFSHFW